MSATLTVRHHHIRAPQIERDTALVPLAAARQVIEEVSLWLGTPLPGRYAARLAFQARRIYAHSASFRAKLRRPEDHGRDTLYVFLRHWLAARLHAEHPAFYRRLPKDFARGASLPRPPDDLSYTPSSATNRPGTSHGFDSSL